MNESEGMMVGVTEYSHARPLRILFLHQKVVNYDDSWRNNILSDWALEYKQKQTLITELFVSCMLAFLLRLRQRRPHDAFAHERHRVVSVATLLERDDFACRNVVDIFTDCVLFFSFLLFWASLCLVVGAKKHFLGALCARTVMILFLRL